MMFDDGRDNPCNICQNRTKDCMESDCRLSTFLLNSNCTNYDCMLNYEDSCIIGIAEKCGACPENRVEWYEDEVEDE